MTNADIITIAKGFGRGANGIIAEVDSFIREHYTKVPTEQTDGKWYKVYRFGTDSKYGHYMIDPIGMRRRNSTMMEFYGGCVID